MTISEVKFALLFTMIKKHKLTYILLILNSYLMSSYAIINRQVL